MHQLLRLRVIGNTAPGTWAKLPSASDHASKFKATALLATASTSVMPGVRILASTSPRRHAPNSWYSMEGVRTAQYDSAISSAGTVMTNSGSCCCVHRKSVWSRASFTHTAATGTGLSARL